MEKYALDGEAYMARPSLTWEADVDLTTLTASLDTTASEIVAYQRDSTVQRKDLAQKTKQFRKLEDASKLAEIKSLLKGRADRLCPLPAHDHR